MHIQAIVRDVQLSVGEPAVIRRVRVVQRHREGLLPVDLGDGQIRPEADDSPARPWSCMACSSAALMVACLRNRGRAAETRGPRAGPIECLFAPLSFPRVSNSGSDTANLLSQYIAESVRIKKAVQPRSVRRSRLQIIQRRLERNVADYAGQAPRKIRGFLMSKQFSSDCGCAAQLQRRNSVKICIQLIEGTERAQTVLRRSSFRPPVLREYCPRCRRSGPENRQ